MMYGRIHETTHKSQEVLSISKFKHENPLHQSQKSSPLLFCEQHRKKIVRFAIAIFYPFTSFLYNFVWCISHKNNAPYIRTATHIRKKCTNNLDSVIIIFRQFFLFYFISFYFSLLRSVCYESNIPEKYSLRLLIMLHVITYQTKWKKKEQQIHMCVCQLCPPSYRSGVCNEWINWREIIIIKPC